MRRMDGIRRLNNQGIRSAFVPAPRPGFDASEVAVYSNQRRNRNTMDQITPIIGELQSVVDLLKQRDAQGANVDDLNRQISALLVKAQVDLSAAAASTEVAGSGDIIVD
jgi:hypothetical protein